MVHLSDWHAFDPSKRKTYPKVDAAVQVRFDDGEMEEGDSGTYFPKKELLPSSSIIAWRYVKSAPEA